MTTRRRFGAGLLIGAPAFAQAQKVKVERGPALAPELVKDFVGAAHANLEKTKALLAETPGLINATWDWGGGDFETALGGASHMGNKEIALFLIENGARMDLFAAAMLGRLDVVKAAVAAFPGIHKTLGPHKIPLMSHAKKGGASAVVEFLESLEKPQLA